jgi:SP family facilitated glucose transporter-like MFS transporter 8
MKKSRENWRISRSILIKGRQLPGSAIETSVSSFPNFLIKWSLTSKSIFKEQKAVIKALIIAIFLLFLRNFSGPLALLNYTASIFQESGSSLTPSLSSILVAIFQLLGNICSVFLVEKAGRKFLFAISFFGGALGLLILGVFTYLKSINVEFFLDARWQWIPLVSFAFVIFIANCGYMAIVFLYIAEIAPQNVKAYISSIGLTISWVLCFIVVKNMSVMMLNWGLHGTVFFFGGISLFGGITTLIFFPETRGKTFDEILRILEK